MQIALTLAVLISKIARIDYPKEWYASYPYFLSMCFQLQFSYEVPLVRLSYLNMEHYEGIANFRILACL